MFLFFQNKKRPTPVAMLLLLLLIANVVMVQAQDNTNSTSNNGTSIIPSSTGSGNGNGGTDVIVNNGQDSTAVDNASATEENSDRKRNMIDAGLAVLVFILGLCFAVYYCINYNRKKKLQETQSIEQKDNEIRLHDVTLGPVPSSSAAAAAAQV